MFELFVELFVFFVVFKFVGNELLFVMVELLEVGMVVLFFFFRLFVIGLLVEFVWLFELRLIFFMFGVLFEEFFMFDELFDDELLFLL